jgi:DNA-binding PadR family transcriptional regulator
VNKLAAMKGDHLGAFEELTLLTVLGLGEQAYGVAVQEKLERDARRAVSLGAVYAALNRLERKGLLVSAEGEATPERGGRRKRMFAITSDGRRVLRAIRATRDRIWRLIESESPE